MRAEIEKVLEKFRTAEDTYATAIAEEEHRPPPPRVYEAHDDALTDIAYESVNLLAQVLLALTADGGVEGDENAKRVVATLDVGKTVDIFELHEELLDVLDLHDDPNRLTVYESVPAVLADALKGAD